MFSLKPIFFSLLFISSSALAINVGKVTTIIPADADSTAKELKNEADSVRIISISAQRISSPMDEGVVINPEQTDELLLTPTRMVMPAGTSNIVKFYYHGKADDRERYYRITFIDEGVSEDLDNGTQKNGKGMTRAVVSTILVVQQPGIADHTVRQKLLPDAGHLPRDRRYQRNGQPFSSRNLGPETVHSC